MNNDRNGKCTTVIKSGRGILNNMTDIVNGLFDKGNICVIFDDIHSDIAGDIAKSLGKNGYLVRLLDCDSTADIPECVKYILGVGGKRAKDSALLSAYKLQVSYSVVALSPSTDCYLSQYCEDVRYVSPDMVVVDYDIIDCAKSSEVASGYGRIISQLTTIFDIDFNRLIFAIDYDSEQINDLAEALSSFEKDKNDISTYAQLMDTLIKISRARANLDINRTAVDCFSKVLSKNLGRDEGENSFIATYIILNVYKCFLSQSGMDILPPPEIIKSLKLLEKMKLINYNSYVSGLNIDNVSNYLKQSFILEEYRRELYDKLNGVDLSSLARYWRRLYDDCGYWLKNYTTGTALLRYLSISSELSENCLLKYLKRLGFLEKYI